MNAHITGFLESNYRITVQQLHRMTTGVGGDSFRVEAADGKYVFKIVKADDINHPELEPTLCNTLRKNGLPVSEFLQNKYGDQISIWDFDRLCHLQRYVDGSNFYMNTAPDWFMSESPLLLARIHQVLSEYPSLSEGIGAGFFTHMTPERAIHSYQHSLALARE